MNRSKRNKIVVGILIIIFVIVPVLLTVNNFPIFGDIGPRDDLHVPSVITNTKLYNVTYANLTYGTNTTTIWETGAMNISDGTNASFIETKITSSSGSSMGDASTDNITYWEEYYRFTSLETVADADVGATSIRAQFAASNGFPILLYDNGTSYSANIDITDMDHFNFSIKASASGSTLSYIRFHNSLGVYYLLPVSQAVTTTWTTYDYVEANATSIGGMTRADAVNWIEFEYSSPKANRWMYIDAPMFYNTTTQRRLGMSVNFTGIAAYDYYSLNVSATSNQTQEDMRISDTFLVDAVYDIDDTGWVNFTIMLNTTTIVANTYFNVFINSTLLDDADNSTLDIDLFQVYAWNETNSFPVIYGAMCTNPDDTDNFYAGYRNYTITLNITDLDGTADIHYARIGLEAEFLVYYWKVGFFEDNKTFVEELYPGNVTLQTTLCSWDTTATTLNITFSVLIEINHTSVADMLLSTFVNDTEGDYHERDFALGYDVEVNADVVGAALNDDRGDWSNDLFANGTVYYFNSTTPLATDYYDVWVYNLHSFGNDTDTTLVAGVFNVTDIYAGGGVGLYTYYIVVVEEGATDADSPLCNVHHTDTYIVDELDIIFTRVLLNPADSERVYMVPVITRVYDDTAVTDYDIVIEKDGVVWKSFDETNFTTEFWDAAPGGESHMYYTDSVVDNTFTITDFDDIPIIVLWYGSHGGDGDGDDDGGEDAWFSWDEWFDLPPMEDAPELYFLFFLVLTGILFGCIVCPVCTRCCKGGDRINPFDYGRALKDLDYIPLILVGKKKKKKKKPRRKFKRK